MTSEGRRTTPPPSELGSSWVRWSGLDRTTVIGTEQDLACGCGELAVVLHSWALFCDACFEALCVATREGRVKQHGGADGALAWRDTAGRWHQARQYFEVEHVRVARARGQEAAEALGLLRGRS